MIETAGDVTMTAFLSFLDRRSGAVLTGLSLVFLTLETFCALHRPLGHDEFSGAWSVAQVGALVPYADFAPYKPVLGYYLQLALLRLTPDDWSGFQLVRLGTAFLSVAVLYLGALRLRRHFRGAAVCLAYGLLVVMTSLVEYAVEFRLDMLTALFGFASLLFLLDRRVAAAGALAGLSFLISQKGAMYALAGGAALLGCWVFQRDARRLRDGLVYGGCVLLPIALYVALWSLIASFPKVYGPTFGQETQLHALATPIHGATNFYLIFWLQTVLRNPFFYLCAVTALVALLARGRAQSPLETMLLCYGATVALILLKVGQPWPYMFVLLVPTAFVLHAYLFSQGMRRPLAWTCYGLLGLAWPSFWLAQGMRDDPGPQRQSFLLAEALLRPGEHYFAGFEFLPRLDAHDRTLGMVDTNTANPVHALSPAEHEAILERFRKEPIRFLVWSPVIDDGVPAVIKDHLRRTYARFWGNVWLYAPQCGAGEKEVHLLFTGRYTVEMESTGTVRIDGRTVTTGETIELERGAHAIRSDGDCRLRLQAPEVEHLLNPAYREPAALFW